MPSMFIGVYQALYPYASQSDQELTIAQGDLLYVLEKSADDDWWKVKKRVHGLETEEPVGLVPNNYIQPAPVVKRARALYEYDKQTEEELSFKENDMFDVYDANDADWILVGLNNAEFGFIPSNYIDYVDGNQQTQQAPETPSMTPSSVPSSYEAKPLPSEPQMKMQQLLQQQREMESSYDYQQQRTAEALPPREESPPPPMPARPRPTSQVSRPSEPEEESRASQMPFYSWAIQEVDGRKKYRATLAIGNGSIMYSPEKSNVAPQKWDVADLVNYSAEKKHVFLDFRHPVVNLDLHAGSKETAEEILSALGEVAGATRAAGLREVYMAANSAGQQIGKVLYNFEAQGDDELSAREGDTVFILDDKKSDEWWMVKNTSGEEGVIPSSYIELSNTDTSKLRQQASQPQRQSSLRRNKSKSEKRREKERNPAPPSKPKPDMAKVRTWTDRSGTFKVDAALLGCADGKIHLHKLNGVKIAVAASKMSVEDLEYIEHLTGVVLDDDKPLVDVKKNSMRKPRHTGVPGGVSTGGTSGATRPKLDRGSSGSGAQSVPREATPPTNQSTAAAATASSKPEYDWFGFFLDCGVDINNCQRYAVNFGRDQMDESVLEDITPQVLRNLGLKEGDILRVTKKLDERFDRRNKGPDESKFSGPGGTLKNNTSKPAGKVDTEGFDDDAWTIKSPPAKPPRPQTSQSAEDLSKPQPPLPSQQQQQPEPTGALKDLLTMQPLQPVKIPSKPAVAPATSAAPVQTQSLTGSTPAINNTAFQQPQLVQATGSLPALPLQQMVTQPMQFAQPMGIQPQQQQPIGFMQTGGLVQQRTGGGMVQQPLGLVQQTTGGFMQQQQQPTGGLIQQRTGGSMVQPLGPFATGNAQPLGPFATGNAQQLGPFATGNTQPSGFISSPATPFMPQQVQQPFIQQHNFSSPNLGLSNQMQQMSLNNGAMGSGMMNTGMNMFMPQQPQNNQFNSQMPMQQQFGMQQQPLQPLQGQPTGFGFGNQPQAPMGTGISASQTLGMQQTGQFPVLVPQKTGPPPPVSFGQAPLQQTPTGRRANLAAATPDNPFGF
ncbi:actin cytoskeleton-regulatory complex protein Sla1p [Trichomonascus vanleenenianus]|uniref:cytoskeletal protein-binding protein SLA1 n=1 Tax=Trichomonascus vanleenenianus TaxID=2268995 RepID=UPI003ECB526D